MLNSTGVAYVLFNRLRSEADVADIAQDQTENLHLDFKVLPTSVLSSPAKLKDVDKLLAKAISGFANSDGGVLVVGVDDKTRQLAPVEDLRELEQRLTEQVSRLVAFPVQGVEVRAIPRQADNTSGFIVICIPASSLAPHRSQKDHRYYRRSGESFVPMEHYEVADMFGRRHQPVLSVVIEASQDHRRHVRLFVSLRNSGRMLAKFPSIEIVSISSPFGVDPYGIDDNGTFGLPCPRSGMDRQFQGGADDVIHAMATRSIFRVRPDYPEGRPRPLPLTLSLRIAAEGVPQETVVVELSAAQIERLIEDGEDVELNVS